MSRFNARLHQAIDKRAKLYITPAGGTLTNGGTLIITIREDSFGVPVNSVQANLTYPTAQLQFQSIDTTASPFTSTVQSNGGGGIVEIGVALLGGSVTGNQLVATVTFAIIATGTASIPFAAGSGIAEEATSTDICQLKIGASFTIT